MAFSVIQTTNKFLLLYIRAAGARKEGIVIPKSREKRIADLGKDCIVKAATCSLEVRRHEKRVFADFDTAAEQGLDVIETGQQHNLVQCICDHGAELCSVRDIGKYIRTLCYVDNLKNLFSFYPFVYLNQ